MASSACLLQSNRLCVACLLNLDEDITIGKYWQQTHATEQYVLLQAEALCCVSLHDHRYSARLPAQLWSVQRHARRPGPVLPVEPRHSVSLQPPCFWKHVICCIPVLTYRKQPSTCLQRHSCRMPVYWVSVVYCAKWTACTACCVEAMCFWPAAKFRISFGSVVPSIMRPACTCAGSSPARSLLSLPSSPSLRTSQMLRVTASMALRLSARAWGPVQLPSWVSFLPCCFSAIRFCPVHAGAAFVCHLLVWLLQQGYTAPWQGKEGPALLDAWACTQHTLLTPGL